MKIHIKALNERTPRSGRPLFECWVDGKSRGKCYESIFEVRENENM